MQLRTSTVPLHCLCTPRRPRGALAYQSNSFACHRRERIGRASLCGVVVRGRASSCEVVAPRVSDFCTTCLRPPRLRPGGQWQCRQRVYRAKALSGKSVCISRPYWAHPRVEGRFFVLIYLIWIRALAIIHIQRFSFLPGPGVHRHLIRLHVTVGNVSDERPFAGSWSGGERPLARSWPHTFPTSLFDFGLWIL